jgi:hypothetical protein
VTTAIQTTQQSTLTPFEPANLEQAMSLATTLAKSGIIPDALRNKPADILVVLMTGRELGIGPMQAMRGIAVINGKAVIGADLMVAQCLRHPDVCQWFRLVESTGTQAKYSTKRAGSEPVEMVWTIEQAKTAGLAGKGPWQSHPAAMLRARASSALARAVYPDLVGGMYDHDEGAEMAPRAPAVEVVVPRTEGPKPVGDVIDVLKQEAAPAWTAMTLWDACQAKYGAESKVEWSLAIDEAGLPERNPAKWSPAQLDQVAKALEVAP